MSKHRVEIDISFSNKKDAMDLMNFVEDLKVKSFKPKGDEKIPCQRKGRYHPCTHDEAKPTPCKDYVNIDFDKVKKIHK